LLLLHLVGSSVLLYLNDDARSNKNQFYTLQMLRSKQTGIAELGAQGVSLTSTVQLSFRHFRWTLWHKRYANNPPWNHFEVQTANLGQRQAYTNRLPIFFSAIFKIRVWQMPVIFPWLTSLY